MRIGTLSTIAIVLGLTLAACGGESVEDRARVLKAAAQKSPPDAADAGTPPTTPTAPATAATSSSAAQ
jgi:hypothetical protein